ncbi:putative quinol monooxygenase [Kribbella kalugense]|uniref:Quinol monooxygenase YgiN n=1 Tax=Kribbella kalugense TaxID=2512221 RepID=A0A4R8A144_9ACTN|nr:antibiotic biosynthesis monooxygenase family protein [Kribbella kalugense]TDW24213.1 quinol monooxygenase YgiN [Kribbella kalugense]
MTSSDALRTARCWLTRLPVRPEHLDDVLAGLGSLAATDDVRSMDVVTVYLDRDDPNSLWLHEVHGLPSDDVREFGDDDITRMLAAVPTQEGLRPVRETYPGRNLDGPVHAGSVVILARLTALPGQRDRALEALEPFMLVADDEPGTEIFTVYESLDEPDVIWMHEVYADDTAFRIHAASPQHKTLRESEVLTGGPTLSSVLAGRPKNWRLTPQLQRRCGEPVRWFGGD